MGEFHTSEREATQLAQFSLVLLTWILARQGQPTPQESQELVVDEATYLVATALAEQLLRLTAPRLQAPLTAEAIREKFESVMQTGCRASDDGDSVPGLTTARDLRKVCIANKLPHCLIKAGWYPRDDEDL